MNKQIIDYQRETLDSVRDSIKNSLKRNTEHSDASHGYLTAEQEVSLESQNEFNSEAEEEFIEE